jgi:FKBP-type peptidyl-prolyl cis-trans isomerase
MMVMTNRSLALVAAATFAVSAIVVSEAMAQQTPTPIEVPRLTRPVPAPPDVAAPPADAVTTASGLATKVLSPGTGTKKPAITDEVVVHYTGWTTNGVMFDSSFARGRASKFVLSRVIPGWGETVQMMVAGEKRRAWIPEALAYKGAEGKPKGLLVFDVELLSFNEMPVTPADVAAAPADATKTKSGLAFKVLQSGSGLAHPKRNSTVTVHYSGWTTDGKMFDSSVMRGAPASFPLDQVIAGWTEGVQLMVEGDKYRFWIPENIAYQGQSGMPKGMLVFDVELIKVNR